MLILSQCAHYICGNFDRLKLTQYEESSSCLNMINNLIELRVWCHSDFVLCPVTEHQNEIAFISIPM